VTSVKGKGGKWNALSGINKNTNPPIVGMGMKKIHQVTKDKTPSFATNFDERRAKLLKRTSWYVEEVCDDVSRK